MMNPFLLALAIYGAYCVILPFLAVLAGICDAHRERVAAMERRQEREREGLRERRAEYDRIAAVERWVHEEFGAGAEWIIHESQKGQAA